MAVPDIPRRVFVVWVGPPAMTQNRLRGLASLEADAGVPVVPITDETLDEWLVPGHPLHPAHRHLSPVHLSDYLRPYLLHHHGGGYSDVKQTSGSWVPAFEALDGRLELLGAGFQEVHRSGVTEFGLGLTRRWELRPLERDWWRYRWLQVNRRRLIGLTNFIFRPGTFLTSAWIGAVEARLDALAPALEASPARVAKERPGFVYDGVRSTYPVPWTYLLGDVLHPLVLRNHRRILQNVPTPIWSDYI